MTKTDVLTSQTASPACQHPRCQKDKEKPQKLSTKGQDIKLKQMKLPFNKVNKVNIHIKKGPQRIERCVVPCV